MYLWNWPPSTFVSSSTEGTLYIDLIDAKKKISLARKALVDLTENRGENESTICF
jgi:hypothetical protein